MFSSREKITETGDFIYSFPLSHTAYLHKTLFYFLNICTSVIKIGVIFFSLIFMLYYYLEYLQSFQSFDLIATLVFLYFFFKNDLSITKKTILLIVLAFTVLLLFYLTNQQLALAYHLFILFALLPFLLNIIANHHLLDIPFFLFINIKTYTCNKVKLFSPTKGKKEHHNTDAIYIDLFFLNQEGDNKELQGIAKEYLRLIKFWYTYENYRFKIRYFFPILGLCLSVSIYLISLFFLYNNFLDIGYLEHISIMSIYLLILFFSINLHANNFLSSKFYMGNILNKLNQIYFDQYEYRHQVKLFLDKNFLVYIHDRNYDQELCVNTSKAFQKFISKETLDKEGRNNILTIFISFIMIFLIEVLVNVKHVEETNQKENTHVPQQSN